MPRPPPFAATKIRKTTYSVIVVESWSQFSPENRRFFASWDWNEKFLFRVCGKTLSLALATHVATFSPLGSKTNKPDFEN